MRVCEDGSETFSVGAGEAPFRVLVAPDKFKGTLTGLEAAEAIRDGILAADSAVEVVMVPIADGGEGTVEATIAAGAERRNCPARGPLDELVEAQWALLGKDAILELSAASGLHLVDSSPRSSLRACTAGTGDVMRAALDAGAQRIVLGVGGSATTDGGTGALSALGARFLDASGNRVPAGGESLLDVARIDLDELDPRLRDVEVVIAGDVAAPLLGPTGAAAVYGPQKGAGVEEIRTLEEGLQNLARLLAAETGRDLRTLVGAGAAGGAAGGLWSALGARLRPGIDVLLELTGFDVRLRQADAVVIGEGSLDMQSLQGKGPIGIARHAQALGIPVFAVAGRIALEPGGLRGAGVHDWESATAMSGAGERATGPEAARWVRAAAQSVWSRRRDTAESA